MDPTHKRVQVGKRGTQLRTRHKVQVRVATLPGAAEHVAGGDDEPDDGTVASEYVPPDVKRPATM